MKESEFYLPKKAIDGWLEHYVCSFSELESIQPNLRSALFPGRRNRPILLLHLLGVRDTSKVCSTFKSAVITIELVHRASLVVDDLVDQDVLRRGEKTYSTRWGRTDATLISHHIVAIATMELGLLGPRFLEPYAQTYADMCLGQRADLGLTSTPEFGFVEHYSKVVLKKTSSLYRLVFVFAAILKGSSDLDSMAVIGESFGELYQLYNDFYDDLYSASYERGGKHEYSYNLSLMTSILADHGDEFSRKRLTAYFGRNITVSHYREIRDFYSSEPFENIARKIIQKKELELQGLLAIHADNNVTELVQTMVRLIRDKYCWDHESQNPVGY